MKEKRPKNPELTKMVTKILWKLPPISEFLISNLLKYFM